MDDGYPFFTLIQMGWLQLRMMKRSNRKGFSWSTARRKFDAVTMRFKNGSVNLQDFWKIVDA
jgi:hypothetical protein